MRSSILVGLRRSAFPGVLFASVLLPACSSSMKDTPGSRLDGGVVDARSPELGAGEPGAADLRASDVGASDLGVGDLGASDLGVGDLAANEIRASEVGVGDGSGEVGAAIGADGAKPGGPEGGAASEMPVEVRDTTAAESLPDRPFLPELAPQLDVTPDLGAPPIDVASDQPADNRVSLDGLSDLGPDATDSASSTASNIFANCRQYTHTRVDSQGKPYTFGVRDVAFTPDGKYLVSFGQDSRAKVWEVTENGLADAVVGGFVIGGDRSLTGAISADGKRVVIGDQDNNLTLYDLQASIQLGAALTLADFPSSALTSDAGGVRLVQLTNDDKYIVAVYSGDMSPDPNHLLVWQIDNQTVVRDVTFDYGDVPRAILPAANSEPMWVASSRRRGLDGGGYEYLVSLVDVATPAPRSVFQFVAPDEAVAATFWPDANTLLLGLDNGEVGPWDLSNKASIVRLGAPLVSASGNDTVLAMASTNDKKYLAVGLGAFPGVGSVQVYSTETRSTLQKALAYYPWSLAFAPDGLALAIGGDTDGALIYCKP
jgi:WD40 repeat protein